MKELLVALLTHHLSLSDKRVDEKLAISIWQVIMRRKLTSNFLILICSPAHGWTSSATSHVRPLALEPMHVLVAFRATIAKLATSLIDIHFLWICEDRCEKQVDQAPKPDQKVLDALEAPHSIARLNHFLLIDYNH